MDSSSISPLAGPTAMPQTQTHAQAEPTAKAAEVTRTNDAKPTPSEDRTRDHRSLQYQVDASTHQVVATIVDESNHTVIRQIPDAEVLRIAQAIDRMQGFLLEGKA